MISIWALKCLLEIIKLINKLIVLEGMINLFKNIGIYQIAKKIRVMQELLIHFLVNLLCKNNWIKSII